MEHNHFSRIPGSRQAQLMKRPAQPGLPALLLSAALSLALLALVALPVLAYRTFQATDGADASVQQILKIIALGEDTLASLTDMETGYRGFLLTGNRDFLEPYEAGKAAYPREVGELEAATADDPVQQRRWQALGDGAGLWQRQVTEPGIASREAMDASKVTLDQTSLLAGAGSGRQQFEGMRAIIAAALGDERARLIAETASARNANIELRNVLIGGSILGMALMAFTAWLVVSRFVAERERTALYRLRAEQAAREKAEAAVRDRDRFLSIAAHELRTPVTGIKGMAQALTRAKDRGLLDNGRLERSLCALDQASDRLAMLVEELLDVSRIRTGRLSLDKRAIDMAGLMRDVVGELQQQQTRPRLLLKTQGSHFQIEVDDHRIRQVLVNLIANAIKYSPEDGEIFVSLTDRDREQALEIMVQDSGIGIPTNSLRSIFEPFGRAHNAEVSNLPGMGLGLYICRQIVHQHGGQIWAESEGEDRGARLVVHLPRASSPVRGSGATASPNPAPAPSGRELEAASAEPQPSR